MIEDKNKLSTTEGWTELTAVVMPERYSIIVRSSNDVAKVIDSGKLDCSYLQDPSVYSYPANLLVENGAVTSWGVTEDNMIVEEWIKRIEA